MAIEIKKLKESVRPYQDADVLLIEAGNILEVRYQTTPMEEPPIQKLDREKFVDKRTGEVREFNHNSGNRQDNIYTVRKSMENLRRIINTNVTEPKNCRWLTLTYHENVTDAIRIYEDFRRFWQKFKRRAKRENWGSPDYISVVEPQARGAWHYHVILIFPKRAPYIDNKIIEKMWGHGFTKIKKLNDSVDNIGAYLCAYLTDITVEEAIGE